MDGSTVSKGIAIATSSNVLKRPRLSLNHPSKLLNADFPIVGACLSRKLAARPFSAYQACCPMCFAPIGRKCVGARGKLRSIPHIPREMRAAEAYRQRIRSASEEAR